MADKEKTAEERIKETQASIDKIVAEMEARNKAFEDYQEGILTMTDRLQKEKDALQDEVDRKAESDRQAASDAEAAKRLQNLKEKKKVAEAEAKRKEKERRDAAEESEEEKRRRDLVEYERAVEEEEERAATYEYATDPVSEVRSRYCRIWKNNGHLFGIDAMTQCCNIAAVIRRVGASSAVKAPSGG